MKLLKKGSNNNSSSENNNVNNLLSLLLLGFEGGLEEGFNPPSEENIGGLDSNVVVLVNILTEVNLGVNYVERESNHIKLTKFEGMKAENPNK